jgi:hypothetical protein
LLVREGQFQLADLARTAMPREKIYEAMRLRGLQHLGQVSRLYMESSGAFSVTFAKPTRPGLSVLPRFDEELHEEARAPGWYACINCATVVENQLRPEGRCSACGAAAWTCAEQDLEQ